MLRATPRSCRERFHLDKLKLKEIQRKYDVYESFVPRSNSYTWVTQGLMEDVLKYILEITRVLWRPSL